VLFRSDYFNAYGAWQPVTPNGAKVLRRFRMPGAQWPQVRWYFVPAWGGLRPGNQEHKLTLPDLAQTPGRYPGVKPGAPRPSAPAARKKHEESVRSQKDPDLKLPEE
jgi:hypothetical protein